MLYLSCTIFECVIVSKATYVTIVGGLETNIVHVPDAQALYEALEFKPTTLLVGFFCVTHQDGTNDFIFTYIFLSPRVNCATYQVYQNIAMYSLRHIAFHISLGTCPQTIGASQRDIELANATIRGEIIVINPKD